MPVKSLIVGAVGKRRLSSLAYSMLGVHRLISEPFLITASLILMYQYSWVLKCLILVSNLSSHVEPQIVRIFCYRHAISSPGTLFLEFLCNPLPTAASINDLMVQKAKFMHTYTEINYYPLSQDSISYS